MVLCSFALVSQILKCCLCVLFLVFVFLEWCFPAPTGVTSSFLYLRPIQWYGQHLIDGALLLFPRGHSTITRSRESVHAIIIINAFCAVPWLQAWPGLLQREGSWFCSGSMLLAHRCWIWRVAVTGTVASGLSHQKFLGHWHIFMLEPPDSYTGCASMNTEPMHS